MLCALPCHITKVILTEKGACRYVGVAGDSRLDSGRIYTCHKLTECALSIVPIQTSIGDEMLIVQYFLYRKHVLCMRACAVVVWVAGYISHRT